MLWLHRKINNRKVTVSISIDKRSNLRWVVGLNPIVTRGNWNYRGTPSVGVFLRDHKTYFREFRRKQLKTPYDGIQRIHFLQSHHLQKKKNYYGSLIRNIQHILLYAFDKLMKTCQTKLAYYGTVMKDVFLKTFRKNYISLKKEK